MSADGLFASADSDFALAVMDALRGDPDVRAVLGDPPRLYDDETRRAAYPYALLERHERFDAGASGICGSEHRLTLVTYSRHGGTAEAKSILGALRAAVDRLSVSLPGQRLVHAHVTYSDAMRGRTLRAFRGVLRIRLVTEEA